MTEPVHPRVSAQRIHLYAWTGILSSSWLIGLTTWRGDPLNTLHVSAQSWAFTLLGFSIAGGLGALAYLDHLTLGRKS